MIFIISLYEEAEKKTKQAREFDTADFSAVVCSNRACWIWSHHIEEKWSIAPLVQSHNGVIQVFKEHFYLWAPAFSSDLFLFLHYKSRPHLVSYTDYGRPVRKKPPLYKRKSTSTPKFLVWPNHILSGTSAQFIRFIWSMPSMVSY